MYELLIARYIYLEKKNFDETYKGQLFITFRVHVFNYFFCETGFNVTFVIVSFSQDSVVHMYCSFSSAGSLIVCLYYLLPC